MTSMGRYDPNYYRNNNKIMATHIESSTLEMDFFGATHWCLYFVGYNLLDSSGKTNWSTKTQWVALIAVATVNIWIIWFTVSSIGDLTLATASFSITISNVVSVSKWATLLRNKATIIAQMQQLKEFNKKYTAKISANKRKMFDAQKKTEKFELIYAKMSITTGFAFCLVPMMQVIWQFFNNEPLVMQLPYLMKLPFEYQHSFLRYCVAYGYNLMVTWFIMFYVPAIDCLFYSYAINLSTHFQILRDNIKADNFEGNERESHQALADYVEHHNFLLELSERMRGLFEPVIFLQFLSGSLLVGLVAFQVVLFQDTRNFSVLVPNLIFVAGVLIELLFYCHGGESLRHESLAVNWAIQESNWYNLSPKLRMPLGFIMQRAQTPVIIDAGIYVATLETFMNIMQAAASYITVMQSLS